MAKDGFSSALRQDVAQNNADGEGKIVWFAFLPHVLLPQRGATFAYPLCMVIFNLVWVATAGDAGSRDVSVAERSSLLLLAGVLAGSLPLVQAHAFVAAGIIVGTYALLDAHKWLASPRILVAWAQAGAIALAAAVPQLRQFSKSVSVGAGGKFLQFGWWFVNHDSGRAGGLGGFFSFWWMNLGPALPLMLAALAGLAWEVTQALRVMHRASPADLDKTYAWGSVAASPPSPAISAAAAKKTKAAARRGAAPGAASGVGAGDDTDDENDAAVAPKAAVAADSASAPPSAPFFLGHVWTASKKSLLNDTGIDLDTWLDIDRYSWSAPDKAVCWWMNSLSLSGRSFDALKLAIGAFFVFLAGNYIMFQPWDRDNCKLFYVGLFVNAAVVG